MLLLMEMNFNNFDFFVWQSMPILNLDFANHKTKLNLLLHVKRNITAQDEIMCKKFMWFLLSHWSSSRHRMAMIFSRVFLTLTKYIEWPHCLLVNYLLYCEEFPPLMKNTLENKQQQKVPTTKCSVNMKMSMWLMRNEIVFRKCHLRNKFSFL